MREIQDFNNAYLSSFIEASAANVTEFCEQFHTVYSTAKLIQENQEDIFASLPSNDCTVVVECLSDAQINRTYQPAQTTSAMSVVHALNYQYLMLVRHVSMRSEREAKLRTGASKNLIDKLFTMSSREIRSMAMSVNHVMVKCHLSERVLKMASKSDFEYLGHLTMLSIRVQNLSCQVH